MKASILINNFNYEQFLPNAITSALCQTYEAVEVVVVDDASTDNSIRVLDEVSDKRLTVIHHSESRGQAAAINTGFEASSGAVIFLLDADDEFKPDKISRVMAVLASHPEAGSCFHSVDRVRNGRIEPSSELGPPGEHDFRQATRDGQPPFIATPTVGEAFRRETFEQILPMPEHPGIGVSDHYLKWTALLTAKTYFLPESLAIQRLHDNNAYTQRDTALGKARIELLNAHALRARFRCSTKLADRLFFQAIGRLDAAESNQEADDLARSYAAMLPRDRRLELTLRRRARRARASLTASSKARRFLP